MGLGTVELRRRSNQQLAISSLPPELLTNIFDIVLQCSLVIHSRIFRYRHFLPGSFIQSFRASRSVLCNVCFHWRKLMITTANFWNILNFPARLRMTPKRNFTIPPSSYSMLETELSRAVNTPIVLYIDIRFTSLDEQIRQVAVSKLLGLMSQSKEIYLYNNSIQSLNLMSTIDSDTPSVPLPHLRTLFVTSYGRAPDLRHEEVIDLSMAPLIQDLEIFLDYMPDGTAGPGRTIPAVQLKLPNIPEFALKRLHLNGAFNTLTVSHIISLSPHLEDLSWKCEHLYQVDACTPPLPVMHKLRHVSLSGDVPLSLTENLEAPNLVVLQLAWPEEPRQKIWAGRPRPLSNIMRSPNLRALRVDASHGNEEIDRVQIARFIEAHPALRVVSVPRYMCDAVATALIHAPSIRRVRAFGREIFDDSDDSTITLLRRWSEQEGSADGAEPVLHLIRSELSEDFDSGDLDVESELVEFERHLEVGSWPFEQFEGDDWDAYLFSEKNHDHIRAPFFG
ncbi:hypothetical protein DL93DRAFT_1761275 [Clavulina sp. PMI_390]|nr:hypothetical protein DL93DRAFT_1761275 [Clavulina sp. PMI_390]